MADRCLSSRRGASASSSSTGTARWPIRRRSSPGPPGGVPRHRRAGARRHRGALRDRPRPRATRCGTSRRRCRRSATPELSARYREHYLARDPDIPLFAGARELLAELDAAGFLLGVATGKSRTGLDRALAQQGLGIMFVATRCADEGFSKPNPDMLLHLMERVGAEPGETLMIGDTTHDLAARAQRRRRRRRGRVRRPRAGRARRAEAARARPFGRRSFGVAARQCLNASAADRPVFLPRTTEVGQTSIRMTPCAIPFAIASCRFSTPSLVTMLAK